MTFNVFVSYAREDSGFALQLARDLKASGVPVWVDQWDISAGVSWPHAIQEALRACTHFLIVLSPYSVASTEVHNELNYVLGKGKHILPVLYAPCEIPYRIQSLEYVDFTTGRQQYQDAVGKLIRLFSTTTRLPPVAPPAARPAPPPGGTVAQPGRRTCALSTVLVGVIALAVVAGACWFVVPQVSGVLAGWLGNRCDNPQELTASAPGGPWSSGDVSGVELVVDGVELSNDGGTSTIHMTAKNNTNQAVRLFLFGRFTVIDNFNTTYEADPFSSSWPDEVPACEVVSGDILLESPLDPNGSPFRATFTNVAIGWGTRDIGVRDIDPQ
ncbi:MAG TPA: toll/interleukin-1 receptor domain-containing protein [Herpetosiphonaceae bacterium]